MDNVARFVPMIGAAALISGCAGSTNARVVPTVPTAVELFSHHKTFHYTGNRQSFIVPADVNRLKIIAVGGMGANTESGGGRAGRVFAVIPVTPKEKLYVFVGGAGSGKAGGFNGGGSGGEGWRGSGAGYGGGGASDIREGGADLKARIIVAGGAGGQGGFDVRRHHVYGRGGDGGGRIGGTGGVGYYQYGSHCGHGDAVVSGGPDTVDAGGCGGTGGRQTQPGLGGRGGNGSYGSYGSAGGDGSLGVGGDGGSDNNQGDGYGGGGGGGAGGGYYGGGGGGGAGGYGGSGQGGGGGGGGGSCFVELTAIKFREWSGWKSGSVNGVVVVSWQ